MTTGDSLGLEELTYTWINSRRETAGADTFLSCGFFLKGNLC